MFKALLNMLIISGAIIILLAGCSKSTSNPVAVDDPSFDLPLIESSVDTKNHVLIGEWTAILDPVSMTAKVEANRGPALRLNVRPYLPNPTITIKSWDPVDEIISVDMTVHNPYSINAFDLRVIIYTDDIGHTLTNADNWTPVYDIPGGLPINPFKAYAKNATNRIFPAYSQFTENLQIKLPGFNPYVNFAIDVSTPENCPEPYEISGFTQNSLLPDVGSVADISFYVSKWNPNASVNAWFKCDGILGSTVLEITSQDNHYFDGVIVNNLGAPEGEYPALIYAKTSTSSLYLYQMLNIFVEDPGEGWALQINDNGVAAITLDPLSNIYTTEIENGLLVKRNKHGMHRWSMDIDNEDNINQGWHLSFNEFIRVTGMHTFCTTQEGYAAGMFSTDAISYWSTYDCMQADGGAAGTSIIGDAMGNSYLSLVYGGKYSNYQLYRDCDSKLIKFDINGDVTWSRDFSADPENIAFTGLAFSPSGSINATGYFATTYGSFTGVDFDPMDGEEIRIPVGRIDGFLAQYTSDGLFSKVATWGSPVANLTTEVLSHGITTDYSNNIIVSGIFNGQVDFDPGPASFIMTSESEGSYFVLKLDPNFNFLSAAKLPMGMPVSGLGAVTTNRAGDVYVLGSFRDTGDFDPGPGVYELTSNGDFDIYLLKLTRDLDFVWVRQWGSTSQDYGYDVTCDQGSGAVYFTAQFAGAIDFDPGPGQLIFTPADYGDSVIVRILPNGYWEL